MRAYIHIVIFIFLPVLSNAQSGIINTIVGNGNCCYSGDNGPAVLAKVDNVCRGRVDNYGNYFIAQQSENVVRKIDTLGIIHTVVGDGTMGYNGDGILATTAQLNYPMSIAFDKHNNLYIADQNNHRIRKVNALTGIITTVAGTGVAGYNGDNIAATTAQLYYPNSICTDTSDNLYIIDHTNFRIRKVNTAGIITTIAGNGIPGSSGDGGLAINAQTIGSADGISTDIHGNIYHGSGTNVRKINIITGIINTVAGNGIAGFSGDGGLATSAEEYWPEGVATDTCGNLYIGETVNYRYRKVWLGTIPPAVSISVNPNDTVCASTAVTFTATATNGGATPTYNWFKNDNLVATGSTYTYIPVSGDSVQCLLHSSIACAGTVLSNAIHITTIPTVTPTITTTISPNDTVCVGTVVSFTTAITNGGTAPTYQWVVNGANVGSGATTYSYTPNNGDSVRCVLTSNAVCPNPVSPSSNSIFMNVDTFTIPTISISGTSGTLVGSTVTINATLTSVGSSYVITWIKKGVVFNTTTVPTVSYVKGTGTDTVSAWVLSTDTTGCYDKGFSDTVYVNVGEGVSNVTGSGQISIYPNPVQNEVTIKTHGDVYNTCTITNSIGQELFQQNITSAETTIHVKGLPVGLYFVKLSGDNSSVFRKFVKE